MKLSRRGALGGLLGGVLSGPEIADNIAAEVAEGYAMTTSAASNSMWPNKEVGIAISKGPQDYLRDEAYKVYRDMIERGEVPEELIEQFQKEIKSNSLKTSVQVLKSVSVSGKEYIYREKHLQQRIKEYMAKDKYMDGVEKFVSNYVKKKLGLK